MAVVTDASGFWIAAAAMLLVALVLLLPPLLRAPRSRPDLSRAALNARIHRTRLAELQADLDSGRLSTQQHKAATDEVMRRVLDEGGAESTASQAGLAVPRARPHRALALLLALAVPVGSIALYMLVGTPAAISAQERLRLPAGGPAASHAPTPQLIAELDKYLQHAPTDGRAWVLLARFNFESDHFDRAVHAYQHALEISPKVARDPQIWCELADALGMQQGGTLAGAPREHIAKALAIDANHPRALEMAGSAEYEAGEFKRALAYWEPLLAQLSVSSQAHRELEVAVTRVKRLAIDH